MYRYAQIDNNGYVVSDSILSGEVKSENMIQIEQDFDLTNKKYNKESQQWETYEPEPHPPPEPQPTLEEQLSEVQDNQLVMMDAMATSYEKETELSDNQLMIMDAIATLFEMQV